MKWWFFHHSWEMCMSAIVYHTMLMTEHDDLRQVNFESDADLLYFVSLRERPWRQRVVQNNMLVFVRVTFVFYHTFKKESRHWRTNDVLQRLSFDAPGDATVVLQMRASIDTESSSKHKLSQIFVFGPR